MLMIEGPKFSGFDFSPAPATMTTTAQSVWLLPEGREPFVINGRRIVLPEKTAPPRPADSDQDESENRYVDDEVSGLSHTAKTAGAVWDCSIILSKYLEALAEKTPEFWTRKRVLELGAGQGIASFSAAALGAERVIITDVDSALPTLRKGVQLNGFVPPQVQVTALDWTDRAQAMDRIWNELLMVPSSQAPVSNEPMPTDRMPAQKSQQQKQRQPKPRLDYILASDVVWVDYLIPALVDTVGELLQVEKERRDSVMDDKDGGLQHVLDGGPTDVSSPPSPVVLLAYQFRSTRGDQLLFDSLDRLGLSRQKLILDGSDDTDKDAVNLDSKFRRPNLAIWKVWKE
ncbi:hypothetical protein BGZ54_004595 [Gamsiella multidivaricata]|nr:hypothetical protein BGZ54_004595 [Gamsiella multidivaricata]